MEVTDLLRRASSGDSAAADGLMNIIGRELRKLASMHMRRERDGHTLQTTAVVNEAFVRLFGNVGNEAEWSDRQHFLAVASRAMRHILVDYARARQTDKRQVELVPLEFADVGVHAINPLTLDVHVALEEFASIAPRQAQMVELRFFGGLTLEEASKVLGVSPRQGDKDWALARAWLRQRLGDPFRAGH